MVARRAGVFSAPRLEHITNATAACLQNGPNRCLLSWSLLRSMAHCATSHSTPRSPGFVFDVWKAKLRVKSVSPRWGSLGSFAKSKSKDGWGVLRLSFCSKQTNMGDNRPILRMEISMGCEFVYYPPLCSQWSRHCPILPHQVWGLFPPNFSTGAKPSA